MDHLTIANFKFGLDTRRSELTSQPGSLAIADNGHINQGGQFEKRKAFVLLGQLPTGCFGLQETPSSLLTFGSQSFTVTDTFRSRTSNVATLTLSSNPFRTGDVVSITGVGGTGYNVSSATVTVSGSTISYASTGTNEASTADTTGLISIVSFFGVVGYQRLRHYIWALDQTAPQLMAQLGSTNHLNPDNTLPGAEPAMTGVTFSCTFGGYAFAVASFGAEQQTGLIAFNPTAPITTCYYNGNPVTSSFQGLFAWSNNGNVSGGAINFWPLVWLLYAANYYIGSTFTFSLATSGTGVNFIGPLNTPYTLVVSDSNGGALLTSITTQPSAPVIAIGASTIIYFTKGASGSVDTLTAPNVVNGALSGTVNLLPLGAVNFNTSLYQTALNVATAVNNANTGYTAQAQLVATNIASLTITAPLSFGSFVNTGQVAIHTTTIFASIYPQQNTGAAGASNYALAGGVNLSAGSGQIQNITSVVPPVGQGTYQCDLVFNNLKTSIGAGYLTRKRSTFVFFLLSGASGSINSIIVNGVNIISAVIPFNTSLQQTCLDIVANIQNQSGGIIPNLQSTTAFVAFPIQTNGFYGVAIQAPLTAQESMNGVNNVVVNTTTIKVADSSANGASGDTTLITSLANGNSDPTYGCSLGGKLYLARGTRINFCASYNAARWEQQDIGSGFITFTDMDTAPSGVVSLCPFQGKLAAFGRRNISIWNVNADPAQYSIAQNLKNIGTMAPLSVQPIGEFDTLFLSDTGIRSLRVRETTLNGYVVDIGSPIDSLIQAALLQVTGTTAAAIVEPGSNRYWCCLNGVIYVLSYFPSLKIIAWSTYQPTTNTVTLAPNMGNSVWNGNLTVGRQYTWNPGSSNGTFANVGPNLFQPGQSGNFIATNTTAGFIGPANSPTDFKLYEAIPFTPVKLLVFNGQVYIIDTNNNVYVYGGTDNNTYDATVATIELPWLDAKTPYRMKTSDSVDVAMSGQWNIYCAMDPRAGTMVQVVPSLSAGGIEAHDSTFDESSFGFSQMGTHFKFRGMTDPAWTQIATMSSFTLQYSLNENQ